MKHCCEAMSEACATEQYPDMPIKQRAGGTYLLKLSKFAHMDIGFCPFCGKDLLKLLAAGLEAKQLRASSPQQTMYGIGISADLQSFGMTHGPRPMVEDLLEEFGPRNAYIIRFNVDGSETILYQWRGDVWVDYNKVK